MKKIAALLFYYCLYSCWAVAQSAGLPLSWDFDGQLQNYFAAETERIAQVTDEELANITDWPTFQKIAREQLLDMLGLNPPPAKMPLNAVVTGTTEQEEFRVEKVHFQSMPGLYVTGNLYIPKNLKKPAPAILYVCGHANVVKNGISYGAKVNYRHHAAWFARNGYVCLIIDTLQLGEIEGMHHGLYRYDRWHWLSLGYTPSGVEAWNDIRAVDYLISRPEVDADRIGMTGRSGGGINTWWSFALDDRIKVAVPVAGITDLKNHVLDGCVEGHCDCMYMVNTYQWDFAKLAALGAPRPLLISNTDQDKIFPIDGVFRIYQQLRKLYEQLGATPKIALNTAAGPHKDLQELRVHAFRWFNYYLQEKDELIEKTAVKFFQAEQLRVFDQLPEDQINTRIDEIFVPLAPPAEDVLSQTKWKEAAANWRKVIDRYAFAQAAPPKMEKLAAYSSKNGRLDLWRLATDSHTQLPLFRLSAPSPTGKGLRIIALDDDNWDEWSKLLSLSFPDAKLGVETSRESLNSKKVDELFKESDEIALIAMRGAGPARFSGGKFEQTHIRRRYYLLGQTLETLQTLDLTQALQALNPDLQNGDRPIQASAGGSTAVMLAYASIYAPKGFTLSLDRPPFSHRDGPAYLSIMRDLDIPATILMASERRKVNLQIDSSEFESAWTSLKSLAQKYPELKLK